ncbi:putative accessory subunit of the mitochondrial membrane respiratory chain NADH dehydrogenase (Complex I), that is believed not to be involved in catalysis [Lyophyllum shimeji]|uniref:Accessory subunit of the mitochondrial membrane respiratory chain NADH dehydrogenase (Complex I), that is believed not to be involved in catalysis n=1 Tax=Lyophyllum shimeji TaxID=47721 RepID=A0A9P3PVN5_LYOSH|nr:putative accessory subunit of the mitochondrial membrane respiratory chain NADH dehydrogenase (Complex I), that is believed not to be involved in catalysis [Lyophyllum shimeji]
MSFIARLLRSFRPSRCVGSDLAGNRYYEHPNLNDARRTRRTVQYRNPEDMWDYIGGRKRLPIQWSTWLSHTRAHPPTLEELQADMARQQRVLANAALIEARDRDERAQMLRLEAAERSLASVSDHPPLPSETAIPQETLQAPLEEPLRKPLRPASEELPPRPEDPPGKIDAGAEAEKPEPWAPRATRRRGS